MVKLVPVDPRDLDVNRLGRRGRVSYPLIKSFLETNQKLCKLDLTGLNKNPNYLRSVLSAYIISHDMPIKIFSAQGDLHLMRLDIDNEGKEIPDWKEKHNPGRQATEGAGGLEHALVATPITAAEVDSRFNQERAQSTK
jgi:hypothetical protein